MLEWQQLRRVVATWCLFLKLWVIYRVVYMLSWLRLLLLLLLLQNDGNVITACLPLARTRSLTLHLHQKDSLE